MAGFIFSISKDKGIEDIKDCFKYGVYSTTLNGVSSNKLPFEGTLADYCSMNDGDNVYFFANRKIYGVGVLRRVGPDCKYKNYEDATNLISSYVFNPSVRKQMLYGEKKENMQNHWVSLFLPDPHFYLDGIDMDDLLSYKPQNLKRIRTFWKTSFIKIDDLENDTIKEFIYLKNLGSTNIVAFDDSFHERIRSRVGSEYLINPCDVIKGCLESTSKSLKHEMALEAILVKILNDGTNALFGKWDYVTHQLCASPFKPIDYMDRIDVFAYRYQMVGQSRVISKYLIVELKAGSADNDTVIQVSKYVDYVCKEYAYGDYGLIQAYIVAHDFSSINIADATRVYNVGSHPIISKKWCDLRLFKYSAENDELIFSEVH